MFVGEEKCQARLLFGRTLALFAMSCISRPAPQRLRTLIPNWYGKEFVVVAAERPGVVDYTQAFKGSPY